MAQIMTTIRMRIGKIDDSCNRKGSLGGDRNGSPRNSPRHTAQSQVPNHHFHHDGDDDENDQGNDEEKLNQMKCLRKIEDNDSVFIPRISHCHDIEGII